MKLESHRARRARQTSAELFLQGEKSIERGLQPTIRRCIGVHAGVAKSHVSDFDLRRESGCTWNALLKDIFSATVTSSSSAGATEVTVDAFGNPTKQIDEQGNITLTEYVDPKKGLAGQVTRVVGASDTAEQIAAGTGDDLVTSYTYTSWGARETETDARGNVSRTLYNYTTGYPVQEIDVFGNATTYSFWEGQLHGTTDADGNSSGFGYDEFGNVTGVTQSNSKSGTSTFTSFAYNTFGDLVSTTDADDNVRTIAYDELGRQTGTTFVWQDPLGILPNQTITSTNVIGPDGNVDSTTDAQGQTSTTLYDPLGRAYQQIDSNGRVTQTIYDRRGLAIESRSEGVDELGNAVQIISRTVYDKSGRAVYTIGSFPLGTDPTEITGTRTIYDADGRVEKTEQLLGIEISLVGSGTNLSAVLASAGTVVSFSSSIYNDAGRVVETYSDTGLRSQTLYGQFGEVVESRSEVPPASGQSEGQWMVSRTIFDSFGRAVISTDRFLVPIDTPLGEDPISGPVPTQITKTIYDERGRTIATERYTSALITLPPGGSAQPGRAAFVIESPGTLESVSETLYDSAGRVWRTIVGRISEASLSPIALSQSAALSDYPTHGTAADRYADLNLSSGVISDTLFDARGRQYASLGHPLPAADAGLSGASYDNKLVRPRTETIYDSLGQASVRRSGLAHVESSTGVFQGVYDNDSVDTKTFTDAYGNAYRTEFITGGTVAYNASTQRTDRSGNYFVDSYTLTHFDTENRPVAEMQAVPGFVTAEYDATLKSFKVSAVGAAGNSPYAFTTINYTVSDPIPTKVYHYDSNDRLSGVSLPILSVNLLSPASSLRPKYEYAYDHQGNQTLIRDPLGRETRFTFTARGQQATRTLPLGFGSDGIPSAAELSSLQSDASSLPFTEGFTYDDRGRQVLHVSFEGVVSENIYDGFGRLSHINYYADQTAYTGETISERWSYEYDDYGRKSAAIHSVNSGGTFTPTRIEETVYDDRGRVIAESVPEGVLAYTYDSQGRMTSTAVFAEGDDFQIDDPKRITSYGYDLLGRLVSVTEDRTPTNTSDDPQLQSDYTFDLAGRMDTTKVTLPPGGSAQPGRAVTTDYDYDPLGRLATQTDRDESNNVLASYDYTVRADGKRTSLEETHWFDADEDGDVDTGEQKTTNYDWAYDAVGRLTDEVIGHWDNAIDQTESITYDQTESFTYDLTGNRLRLDRDLGNNGNSYDPNSNFDFSITYDYDVNDRLITELFDDKTEANADTTTIYDYHNASNIDTTQQHSKTITAGSLTTGAQHFTYNLQGRIATVINDSFDASGILITRDRTTYSYDSKSYRVNLAIDADVVTNGAAQDTWTNVSSTEFLADHRNHTGYVQTIRETTVNADDTSKTVDYTFGHDEIAQRTVQRDDEGIITSEETLVFGHDGHGSVRVLYDLAETTAGIVNQVATFARTASLIGIIGGSLIATTFWFA